MLRKAVNGRTKANPMQTTRIISNISYNTDEYFKHQILDLLERGVIDWAYWIRHKADEDDEKEHIHFVLKPSRRLDTTDLRNHFNEYDENNDLPLTCTMRWYATNSLDDWLLYAIHHTAYLNSKGQSRRYSYDWKDIQTTDKQALKNDIANIDLRKYMVLQWLEDAVYSNIPFYQLVQQGLIPISQRSQYEFQYKAIKHALSQELEKKRKLDELERLKYLRPVQAIIESPYDEQP